VYLYKTIAELLREQILQGILEAGQKLPSIRQMSVIHGISTSTIVQAYHQIEKEGLIESRYRMGYFVIQKIKKQQTEQKHNINPMIITNPAVMDLLSIEKASNVIPLHISRPEVNLLPRIALDKSISRCMRINSNSSLDYSPPLGNFQLRSHIQKHYANLGLIVDFNEILITSGAMESISLAIRVLTKPNDIVLIESPTYEGILQCIAIQGLRVIELKRLASGNFDFERLEIILKEQFVRAFIFVPNCSNPCGTITDDVTKMKIMKIINKYNTIIIEDDVYGELAWTGARPSTLRTYDTCGRVILCSSFSKTLAPGMRVGWIFCGKWINDILRAKYFTTVGNASLPQLAIANYLDNYNFDRHLKKLRNILFDNAKRISDMIVKYWPTSTVCHEAKGGLSIWVKLPENYTSHLLCQEALKKGIGVKGGHAFSIKGEFTDHIRLNCGVKYDERVENALKTLGKILYVDY